MPAPTLLEAKRATVFELLTKIPRGKVVTYKQLAQMSGIKNPRLIGRILHTNVDGQKYPCHRVIKSDGTVASGYAFGEQHGQIIRLRQEGVEFLGGKVDLSQYQWLPE